jgi:hypothetical protein
MRAAPTPSARGTSPDIEARRVVSADLDRPPHRRRWSALVPNPRLDRHTRTRPSARRIHRAVVSGAGRNRPVAAQVPNVPNTTVRSPLDGRPRTVEDRGVLFTVYGRRHHIAPCGQKDRRSPAIHLRRGFRRVATRRAAPHRGQATAPVLPDPRAFVEVSRSAFLKEWGRVRIGGGDGSDVLGPVQLSCRVFRCAVESDRTTPAPTTEIPNSVPERTPKGAPYTGSQRKGAGRRRERGFVSSRRALRGRGAGPGARSSQGRAWRSARGAARRR